MLSLDSAFLLFLTGWSSTSLVTAHSVYDAESPSSLRRHAEATSNDYYYTTSDPAILGRTRRMASLGNPLKGLCTSPRWLDDNDTPDYTVASTLEFYYIGLDEIVKGRNRYDWSVLDDMLSQAAMHSKHVIWRVFCHYPGRPLTVPQYVIDAGTKLVDIEDGGVSPQYDDPLLLLCFKDFIAAFGKRYDGNKAIAFIQLGLLGKWGEWHTYPDDDLISDATKDKVVTWYTAAFNTTRLQVRGFTSSAYAAGMGLHDDSFAYSSLGDVDWFTLPKLERAGYTDFWKRGVMGGETRPEIQGEVFDPGYQTGSESYKQDMQSCIDALHATYLLHHSVFNGDLSAEQVPQARRAHARLGYNFQVTHVGVVSTSNDLVTVNVTVAQVGTAPFYYPLSLMLSCPGTTMILSGVETLIEKWDSSEFSFQGVPSDAACLQYVNITLESEFTYPGTPIKFAQGKNGLVQLAFPLPLDRTRSPATAPVVANSDDDSIDNTEPPARDISEDFGWMFSTLFYNREH